MAAGVYQVKDLLLSHVSRTFPPALLQALNALTTIQSSSKPATSSRSKPSPPKKKLESKDGTVESSGEDPGEESEEESEEQSEASKILRRDVVAALLASQSAATNKLSGKTTSGSKDFLGGGESVELWSSSSPSLRELIVRIIIQGIPEVEAKLSHHRRRAELFRFLVFKW